MKQLKDDMHNLATQMATAGWDSKENAKTVEAAVALIESQEKRNESLEGRMGTAQAALQGDSL